MNKKQVECMFCGRPIIVQRGTMLGYACSRCLIKPVGGLRSRDPELKALRKINAPYRQVRLAPIPE